MWSEKPLAAVGEEAGAGTEMGISKNNLVEGGGTNSSIVRDRWYRYIVGEMNDVAQTGAEFSRSLVSDFEGWFKLFSDMDDHIVSSIALCPVRSVKGSGVGVGQYDGEDSRGKKPGGIPFVRFLYSAFPTSLFQPLHLAACNRELSSFTESMCRALFLYLYAFYMAFF